MKKKDIVPGICFLLAIGAAFGNENFGFVPMNGAQSLGSNFAVTLIYVGAFWFIWGGIKNFRAKRQTSPEQKIENK